MSIRPYVGMCVLSLLCGAAAARDQSAVAVAGLRDGNNDQSADFDANVAPAAVPWLQLAAGIGSAKATSAAGDLDGTTVRAALDLQSDRLGLRGYYRRWDTDSLDTNTSGLRASAHEGGLTLSVIGERRHFDVSYRAEATADSPQGLARFSASGGGGGLAYQRNSWNGYVEAVYYHYNSLRQYVPAQSPAPAGEPASALPALPVVPVLPSAVSSALPTLAQSFEKVLPAVAGSYVTLNQGALAHLWTAGIARDSLRSTVRLDWTGARDAILDVNTNAVTAGYRYVFTQHLNAGVTVGRTRSRYAATNLCGLSLGMSF